MTRYRVHAEWVIENQGQAFQLAGALMHMGADSSSSEPLPERPAGFRPGCPREGCPCHTPGPVCEECMCVDGQRHCPRCGWIHDKHAVCIHNGEDQP